MKNWKNQFQNKNELIKQYQQRKPEKIKTAEEMGLNFEDSFRDLDNFEDYKEESEWLLKIRDGLSDIEFPSGVLEYSIANPEGIYLMVMELRKMYEQLQKENKHKYYDGYAMAKFDCASELLNAENDRRDLIDQWYRVANKIDNLK